MKYEDISICKTKAFTFTLSQKYNLLAFEKRLWRRCTLIEVNFAEITLLS